MEEYTVYIVCMRLISQGLWNTRHRRGRGGVSLPHRIEARKYGVDMSVFESWLWVVNVVVFSVSVVYVLKEYHNER